MTARAALVDAAARWADTGSERGVAGSKRAATDSAPAHERVGRLTAVRYRLGQVWDHIAGRHQGAKIPADFSSMVCGEARAAFNRLDGADQRHLVDVAMALQEAGWEQDVVLAGLLHDIGKGPGVSIIDRGLWVIFRSCLPSLACRIAKAPEGRRLGSGLRVLARHATIGAGILEDSGYNERVCWLVRHHEDTATTDAGLRALIAADNAQRIPEAGGRA